MSISAAIEKALEGSTPQRLVRLALTAFAGDLQTAAKKNTALEYHSTTAEQTGDAKLITEVLVPAFAPQTALELETGGELRAYLVQRFTARLRKLQAALDSHSIDGDSEDAVDSTVLATAGNLADEVATLAGMIADRAHHDGVQARQLAPAETMRRVMHELAGAKEDTTG